ETLNSQLERSVLLDADMDRTLRISRWPRVFAAAAIVILTSGLAVAVWFALPKGKPVPYATNNRPEPAISPMPAPSGREMRGLKGGAEFASKEGKGGGTAALRSIRDAERAEGESLDAFAKRVLGNNEGIEQDGGVTGG